MGFLICGGDLNIHLETKLDRSNGKTLNMKSLVKKINTLFEEVGLIDIWRDSNPKKRDYTHYSSPHLLYTRIYYFLTFWEDKQNKLVWNWDNSLSGHAAVYLSVNLNLQPKNVKYTCFL